MKVQFLGTRAKLFKKDIEKLRHDIEIIDDHNLINKSDLCLVSGYYKIIPKRFLKVPKFGIIGFHETNLPKGRGSAPINWTIIKGFKNLVVSMFEITSEMDAGRIYAKKKVKINKLDTFYTLREKANRLIRELIIENIPKIEKNQLKPYKQKGNPTYYRKRKPEDSELNINKSIKEQWNLMRACSNKDYPAFFKINDKKVYLYYKVES